MRRQHVDAWAARLALAAALLGGVLALRLAVGHLDRRQWRGSVVAPAPGELMIGGRGR